MVCLTALESGILNKHRQLVRAPRESWCARPLIAGRVFNPVPSRDRDECKESTLPFGKGKTVTGVRYDRPGEERDRDPAAMLSSKCGKPRSHDGGRSPRHARGTARGSRKRAHVCPKLDRRYRACCASCTA